MVKKRLRRWGGEDVGWDVSALSSHCKTDILRMVKRLHPSGRAAVPYCTVETSGSETKALTDVLQEQIPIDLSF